MQSNVDAAAATATVQDFQNERRGFICDVCLCFIISLWVACLAYLVHTRVIFICVCAHNLTPRTV